MFYEWRCSGSMRGVLTSSTIMSILRIKPSLIGMSLGDLEFIL